MTAALVILLVIVNSILSVLLIRAYRRSARLAGYLGYEELRVRALETQLREVGHPPGGVIRHPRTA